MEIFQSNVLVIWQRLRPSFGPQKNFFHESPEGKFEGHIIQPLSLSSNIKFSNNNLHPPLIHSRLRNLHEEKKLTCPKYLLHFKKAETLIDHLFIPQIGTACLLCAKHWVNTSK